MLTTVTIWYRVTRDVKEISQYLEYGPTRLVVKLPTIAFTLKNRRRHYAKQRLNSAATFSEYYEHVREASSVPLLSG